MTPGVHVMSMADYQRDPAPTPSLSSGIAHKIITQSPLHGWIAHPRLNPNHKPEEDSTFDLGACAHAVLLEGEESIASVEADDWRTKAAKEARDQARAQGKIPVLSRKLPDIRAMADEARSALKRLKAIKIDLPAGMAERVLLWQEGDVWCRARPDWISNDRRIMLAYKSTAGSAEPGAGIRNQLAPMGFDMQSVHYMRGNEMTGGPAICDWIFLVQENYAPFACSFVGLSSARIEIAQKKLECARELWRRCLAKNVWLGYPPEIAYAEPQTWEMDEHEMRILTFDQRLEFALA